MSAPLRPAGLGGREAPTPAVAGGGGTGRRAGRPRWRSFGDGGSPRAEARSGTSGPGREGAGAARRGKAFTISVLPFQLPRPPSPPGLPRHTGTHTKVFTPQKGEGFVPPPGAALAGAPSPARVPSAGLSARRAPGGAATRAGGACCASALNFATYPRFSTCLRFKCAPHPQILCTVFPFFFSSPFKDRDRAGRPFSPFVLKQHDSFW